MADKVCSYLKSLQMENEQEMGEIQEEYKVAQANLRKNYEDFYEVAQAFLRMAYENLYEVSLEIHKKCHDSHESAQAELQKTCQDMHETAQANLYKEYQDLLQERHQHYIDKMKLEIAECKEVVEACKLNGLDVTSLLSGFDSGEYVQNYLTKEARPQLSRTWLELLAYPRRGHASEAGINTMHVTSDAMDSSKY